MIKNKITAAPNVDPNDGRAINLNVSIVDENIEAGGHNQDDDLNNFLNEIDEDNDEGSDPEEKFTRLNSNASMAGPTIRNFRSIYGSRKF